MQQTSSEQSLGDRKTSATSKSSMMLHQHYNSGSSNKKSLLTSHDKQSINNRPRLLIDIETPPNKNTFEFGNVACAKSNDKLSS